MNTRQPPEVTMHKLVAVLGFLLAYLVSGSALAQQIYRSVDENGNVVFSDQPPAPGQDAEQVELGEMNTAAPLKVRPQPAPAAEEPEPAPEARVSISSPDDENTIAMGPGNFSVSGRTEPALGPGERLQLFMDGEAVGPPQTDASWGLQGVLRGPHDLVIRRVTADGKVLAESDSVRIYVLRPSIR
ncbi:DUF4124 domain-containing protein [Pseudohaliea rubra]|uniref:DUF4124 domain-containing protein n=1 Tax=Pseudohaliea rubra DSM 19751 TaxID=1265313 RepID=A0A095VS15_9GAMM|nr:DUF4124 domain-containing protein [Pseudohaliea rubra]KGE03893.1 hypothetical protein HRUBRA_01510 [Pseudohaliea rubra DSM 19751]